MSEGAKTLRLSKVAKEFNLSLGKIVEFLAAKGHPVESNPNAKIGDEEYGLLLKEFSSDKSAREEAQNVAQTNNKLKRETIILGDLKSKKQQEEEFDEVVIKDLTASKITANEKKETLDTNATTVITKPELEIVKEGPKVIGKLDLDSMNLKTKPDKKTKKETEKVDAKADTEKANKTKNKSDETKVEDAIIEPVIEIPAPKEEVKEEFHITKYEKLEGPKILGKVELPVIKETPKKTAANANSAADKKKRKRIRKGGLSQEEIKKVGKELLPAKKLKKNMVIRVQKSQLRMYPVNLVMS
jgi:translation initiation factor IF-2